MEFPVLEILEDLRQKLALNNKVLLEAPPGAGKSTVLPLKLFSEPWLGTKKIILLEPRRLAAKSVALRLAQLAGSRPGEEVGYRIRFETQVSERTRLEVVTEGILTRMMQEDPTLESVGLLIFDEFHERNLHSDLGLAMALQLQQVLRDDLRLLLMSATLHKSEILQALPDLPVITSAGRQFPIDIRYLDRDLPTSASLSQEVGRLIQRALGETSGDVLVFLPGAGEIRRTAEFLRNGNTTVEVHQLYGDMPFQEQEAALKPSPAGTRKVVLATSIAETSLTIEGVHAVVDAGLARTPRYDPRSGFTRLETVKVTGDAADQRAGRAGRLGPGVAFRMWTRGAQHHLVPARRPEILEADLASLVLELFRWGVHQPDSLVWITKPPAGTVRQAIELLAQLGAIDDKGITDRGLAMAKLPAHPRIAHLLLEAEALSAQHLALATDLAALFEDRDPLPEQGADIYFRLAALRRWRTSNTPKHDRALERVERSAAQWRRLLKVAPLNSEDLDGDLGKLVFHAYPERLARQVAPHQSKYKMANGHLVRLPDNDALSQEPWLIIARLDAGTGEGKIFLATGINPAQVRNFATPQTRLQWDADREAITGQEVLALGALVLESRAIHQFSDADTIPIILEQIRNQGLRKFLPWSDAEEQWQQRVLALRQWRPGEGWPDVADEALLATLETWLTPFLNGVTRATELRKLDWPTILQTLLPYELQSRLEALAPKRLTVPTGSQIRLTYFSDGQAPVLEVRLQEVFGWFETPSVNDGRTPVVLHLLSPGYKPVQVTRDLASFWRGTYHEVRKELKIRYPKHAWPEDPLTAVAVKKGRSERS